MPSLFLAFWLVILVLVGWDTFRDLFVKWRKRRQYNRYVRNLTPCPSSEVYARKNWYQGGVSWRTK